MLDQLLIKKSELCKLKISLKNPFGITPEQITQTPRSFNTKQIQTAVENVSLDDIQEIPLDEIPLKSTEYLLKDFFLYMHQTGLYNRQFNLWRSLGNIKQLAVCKLQKGWFKKKELPIYLIDFFIDLKRACIKVLVHDEDNIDYDKFKIFLKLLLSQGNKKRLKGIFYFLKRADNDFLTKLTFLTRAFDSISKYESHIKGTRDVRLNVLTFERQLNTLFIKHVYPELKPLLVEG